VPEGTGTPACGRRNVDRAAPWRRAGRLVQLRQAFNDTNADVLWLIIGAPKGPEFLQGSKSNLPSC